MTETKANLYDVSDTSESDAEDPPFEDDFADLIAGAVSFNTVEAEFQRLKTGPQPPGARWQPGNLWAKNIPEWTDPTRTPYLLRHPAIRPSDTRRDGDVGTARVPSEYAL